MNAPGKLYLMPVPINEEDPLLHIPAANCEIARKLEIFIAEDAKIARRNLKLFGYTPLDKARILLLNEHSKPGETDLLLQPLLEGQNAALMSDAGCPGIADPGAVLVELAHKKGIEVVPLSGPSSIVLSIMASGFNTQSFAFNGYLPVDRIQRQKRIKELEQIAIRHKQAQFFIETPYRNVQIMEALLSSLSGHTRLFLGINIGATGQKLQSLSVSEWKKAVMPAINKVPVVFGIYV